MLIMTLISPQCCNTASQSLTLSANDRLCLICRLLDMLSLRCKPVQMLGLQHEEVGRHSFHSGDAHETPASLVSFVSCTGGWTAIAYNYYIGLLHNHRIPEIYCWLTLAEMPASSFLTWPGSGNRLVSNMTDPQI